MLGHDHGRIGALELRHHVGDRVLDVATVVGGDHRGDDLRVGRAPEVDSLVAQAVVELDRVDQVSVVGEGQLAAVVAPDRLGVLPGAAAGGRVPDVADRHRAGQRPELLLVEYLGDEAGIADRRDVATLAGRDPGRFLPPVLECVEAEVGESGYVPAGSVYTEHPALVTGSFALRNRRFVGGAQRLSTTCCSRIKGTARECRGHRPGTPCSRSVAAADAGSAPFPRVRSEPYRLNLRPGPGATPRQPGGDRSRARVRVRRPPPGPLDRRPDRASRPERPDRPGPRAPPSHQR